MNDTLPITSIAFQESIPTPLSGDCPEFRRACAQYERKQAIAQAIASLLGWLKAAGTLLAISFFIALCVVGTEDLSTLVIVTITPLAYIGMCALSIAANFLFIGLPIYGIYKLVVWLKDSRARQWLFKQYLFRFFAVTILLGILFIAVIFVLDAILKS